MMYHTGFIVTNPNKGERDAEFTSIYQVIRNMRDTIRNKRIDAKTSKNIDLLTRHYD